MGVHAHSVYRTMAKELEEQMTKGRIRPGEKIKSERTLMREYGVERTTVRRALALLEEKGLVERRTGVGTFASDGKTGKTGKKTGNAKASATRADHALPEAVAAVYEALVRRGHEAIAVVTLSPEIFGLAVAQSLADGVYRPELLALAPDEASLAAAFGTLSRSGTPFSAVVTATAKEAQILMKEAEKLHLAVPEKLSAAAVTTAGNVAGCVFDTPAFPEGFRLPTGVKVSVLPCFVSGETLADAYEKPKERPVTEYLF